MSADDCNPEIYKLVKGDYHTEVKLCTIVRRHTLGTNAAAQNGILHIIIEMINKLLVCPQHDCNAEIYKKDESDYQLETKLLYHC